MIKGNEVKYNEIYLLVHPLYVNTFEENYKDLKQKTNLISVKRLLDHYGRILLTLKNKPKAVFIIALDSDDGKEVKSKDLLKRFLEFGGKNLGKRFIVTDFGVKPGGEIKGEIVKESFYSKIEPEVKIKAFGELGNVCVLIWSGAFARELRKKGFAVNRETLSEFSLSSRFGKPPISDRKVESKVEQIIDKRQKEQLHKEKHQRDAHRNYVGPRRV